jgi:hypothetical protein
MNRGINVVYRMASLAIHHAVMRKARKIYADTANDDSGCG